MALVRRGGIRHGIMASARPESGRGSHAGAKIAAFRREAEEVVMERRRRTGMAVAAAGAVSLVGYRLLRMLLAEDLAGEVVLVTGGSRGLGLQLAREFGRRGCKIVICARDTYELERARRDLHDRGIDVLPIPCDIALRDEVENMVESVDAHFGGIDILVNNAGMIQVGPIETMALEDFEQAMAVNFWGAVYATMAVLPQMRARQRGRIVNITSIGGKVAVPHLLPYDCAKFAFLGFSEGLHAELAKDGIRVTTIIPGLMRTGSSVNAFFKGRREAEFAWFGAGDATPLTAMSATRAARRIVEATRRGEGEVTLSVQAKLLRLAHDLFPQLTTDVLGVVNRMLPSGADLNDTSQTLGMALRASSPWGLGDLIERDAKRYNQHNGPSNGGHLH
jgi:NAD(P)-dependent dehydrogenase (short-subunit alcohol dehydrogenase family)